MKPSIRNFLVILFLLVATPAFSQNNSNVLSSSGNVGVGTTTPNAKLQVSGRAVFDSSLVVKDSSYFLQNMRLGEDLNVEGNLRVTGSSFFYDRAHFQRITTLPGDSILHLGDSSILYIPNAHVMYSSPTSTYSTYNPILQAWSTTIIRGLRIGNNGGYAHGSNSLALGSNVRVGNVQNTGGQQSIVIGRQISTLLNNSLVVGFNTDGGTISTAPTFYVGPSAVFNQPGQVGIATTAVAAGHNLTVSGDATFDSNVGIGDVSSTGNTMLRVVQTAPAYANEYTATIDNPERSNGLKISCGTYGEGGTDVGTILNCVTSDNHEVLKVKESGRTYAREVVVNLNSSWPDYVFDENYNILSLDSLESYIEVNKHLPEVLSQDEVKEGGINVAEMDAVLLKKIEELTLYLLELKKENEAIKVELEELKKK